MKSTGIIRKIDELGRIVIPKEIRKVLKIDSGDDLEIFVDDGKVILKKYSFLLNIKESSDKLITTIEDLTNGSIYITDKDKVITTGELENKNLNKDLKQIINERKSYISSVSEKISFGNLNKEGFFIINPIIQDSDANGLVIVLCKEKPTKEDTLFASILKNIIENT